MNIRNKYQIYVRPGKTREEMKELQRRGLILLHEGLLHAFEVGCKPHADKDAWIEPINKLEKSCDLFLMAATPFLSGGLTSNTRLAILAMLEASSIRVDAGLITNDHLADTQFAIEFFESKNEPLGIAAARVIQFINVRHSNLDIPFDIDALLAICVKAISIDRTRSAMERLTDDISKFGLTSHAFPERDIILLTLLHKSISFKQWKNIFEEYQREELPHFELEIATVLIAFIIAVATAVTSNAISEVIKNWINDKRKLKENLRSSIRETEIEEKLNYLLKGYSLREFHLQHPKLLEEEAFKEIWHCVRNNETVPDAYLDTMKKLQELQEQLYPELRADADALLDKLEEMIIDHFTRNGESEDFLN